MYNILMRDIVIIYPSNDKESWSLDIDIVNNEPRYVATEGMTYDQRAALAAMISKGTIPGALEEGVNWDLLLSPSGSLTVIDNEVRRQINKYAASGEGNNLTQYIPVYKQSQKGGVDVSVYRTV